MNAYTETAQTQRWIAAECGREGLLENSKDGGLKHLTTTHTRSIYCWGLKMPKKIITVDTLPIALSLLHNWQGKLTWQRYSETLAYRLNVERIAKRSLYKHDEIVTVFNQVKNRLNQQKAFPHSPDATIQELRKELESVKSQLQHEKQKTHNLQNAFLRLQRNIYMLPGMDLEKLKKLLTEPLPNEVAREGR